MYPTTVWADDRFSMMFGNNYPEWGNVMNLSLLNRGGRDESKGCTTFVTDICAVCLDDVRGLTPFNRPAFMPFLTTRTFAGLFTLPLRSFEAIGGWGTTAVLTVHV
jgi:hypothetical protein